MLPGVPTFKDKLDWLAEQRDWSINQIAKKADVPQSTLHKALNGQMIRVDAAIRLAQTMDVSVEWLFDNRYDLKDLPKRPFWLPPNLDPATGVILEGLQKGLDQLVREKHGIGVAPKPNTPSRKSGAVPKGAASPSQRRRKSGGEGA